MPKNKTHSGMKKRVKVTGTGKLRVAARRHAAQPRAQVVHAHPPPVRHQDVSANDAPRMKRCSAADARRTPSRLPAVRHAPRRPDMQGQPRGTRQAGSERP